MIDAPRRILAPTLITALLLLSLAAVRASAQAGPEPAPGVPDEAVLITTDAPADAAPDAAPLAQLGGSYRSAITAAPRPFTHMLLRWDAAAPDHETVRIEVRASLDGSSWSDWGAVEENPDLWAPEDGPERFWGQEIYAGEGARFWQVRAELSPAADGAVPQLRTISVFTVDARFGPADPAADMAAPSAAGEPAALGKPAVVSRTAWGSPDGQGSRAAPAYRRVNHMVVHHTADSNSLAAGQRWSDRVRAIWSFHTITRGWGDIGYNYLVDPNGVVYEGRAGGDDAVAFHDTANYGSMGVAMIGTYKSGPPPAAAMNSLVALLAWKADQRDIDPLGRSFYYGCSISQYCSPFNAGAVVSNIAGHRDVTPGHTTCPGDSLEALVPQIRERVRAALTGAPPPDEARLELLGVSYGSPSVAAGELLKVTFTVRNSGSVALQSQAPEAARDGGAYALAESYVYDEGECFLGAEGQSYPAYPKEQGRIRVTLGPLEAERQPACAGGTGGYPWRWGINGSLAPGEVREVVGYLRLRTPGTLTLRAGAISEYVGYMADGVAQQTITVVPERQMPAPAAYDDALRPLAHVYRLPEVPGNLLARAADSALLPRGTYLGSFGWGGEVRGWGAGGPLEGAPELTDRFMVEQTRSFIAPVAGAYSFQVTADDGGWLWVDGRLVAGGPGAQDGAVCSGTVTLEAGSHVVSFRAYELSGDATMGYLVQPPGAAGFGAMPDGLVAAGAERIGAGFRSFTGMSLVADDMGGAGVSGVRVAVNGGDWTETPGRVAQLGPLPDGTYSVRYMAVDALGNLSEERTLSFRVDAALPIYHMALPLVRR